MALIETQHIAKAYEQEGVRTDAIRDVTLQIEQGEFIAIMGPSGSGKSTLLHILGFLERPSSGHYVFDGHDRETTSERDRARIRNEEIGFVFQAFNLLARTTVMDNVLLPLLYSAVPAAERKPRALKALEEVAMTHRLQHTSGQLSGGEKQRVAIARALVNRPKVIFADEPTGNLDSVNGQAVLKILDQLHAQGHTVILITHETPTAQYAQRVLQMKDGRIVSDERNRREHAHFTK